MSIYHNGLDFRANARPASERLNVAVSSSHSKVDRSTKKSVGNSRSAYRCRCAPNSNRDVDRLRGYRGRFCESSTPYSQSK